MKDQYRSHETFADKEKEKAVLDKYTKAFGFSYALADPHASFDALIINDFGPFQMVEVKNRNNVADLYPTLQIDVAKIDGLIASAEHKGVAPVLIVSWLGDVRYIILSRRVANFAITTTKRRDRDEFPDRQYHIPISMFSKI